jgi:hypothetical protein
VKLTEELKLSMGVEILILGILDKILNIHKVGSNGEDIVEPRELPLSLQYKLNCNKILLENDYNKFDEARIRLLMKYGIANKDIVSVDPNKLAEYQEELNKLLDTETIHYVTKLSSEDFEDLSKDIRTAVSTEEFKVLLDYLVEDTDLQAAYAKSIHFNLTAPKTEEPKEEEITKSEESKPKATKKSTSKAKASKAVVEIKDSKRSKVNTIDKPKNKRTVKSTKKM